MTMPIDEVISTKDGFTIALIGTEETTRTEDGFTTLFVDTDDITDNTNKNDKIIPFYNKDIPVNYQQPNEFIRGIVATQFLAD